MKEEFYSFCVFDLHICFDLCGGWTKYDDFPVFQDVETGELIQSNDKYHQQKLSNWRLDDNSGPKYRLLTTHECMVALLAMFSLYKKEH